VSRKLRRGLRADLEWVFAEAYSMQGAYDSDSTEKDRVRISALKREVLALLYGDARQRRPVGAGRFQYAVIPSVGSCRPGSLVAAVAVAASLDRAFVCLREAQEYAEAAGERRSFRVVSLYEKGRPPAHWIGTCPVWTYADSVMLKTEVTGVK
jgi:hypothetical protein